MVRFIGRQIDVLIATTIIETGIDIPNVNTIFIHECDRFGLADLHQLRGRVGRSRHKAYCYLVLPEHRHVNPDAKKRVQAIREFSNLGAGFQIAMRDLEIRGSGNILGAEQSGHIAVVGYDLYCRLLERAVKKTSGHEPEQAVDVQLELNLEAFIPESLVPSRSSRLDLYRRLSKMQEIEEVEELAREIEDRFGEIPKRAQRLLEVQILRILALSVGLHGIGYDEESILLTCTEAMQPLLDACPLRVVVLEPANIAVVVNSPTKSKRADLDDELVFKTVFKWLKTGKFPRLSGKK
jgi:transcription-repair coupling factor (superfamily II helicase)